MNTYSFMCKWNATYNSRHAELHTQTIFLILSNDVNLIDNNRIYNNEHMHTHDLSFQKPKSRWWKYTIVKISTMTNDDLPIYNNEHLCIHMHDLPFQKPKNKWWKCIIIINIDNDQCWFTHCQTQRGQWINRIF